MVTNTGSIDRYIHWAKTTAREAYDKRAGTQYLTALQRGFYNRFAELDAIGALDTAA